MSLSAQLKKAKDAWNKAKEIKSDFDSPIPDGQYVGKLVTAEVGESQSSGRLQVHFKAVVSTGEYKGETINWYSGLKSEQNFMYLQRDITRLGKEVPEDINDLEEVLSEIAKEKPSIRFKVVTSGDFTNVRLLKKLNSEEAPDEDVSDEEPEDAAEEPAEPEVEEVAEEPAEEPEDTIDVGMRVAFDVKGKEVVGSVVSVDAENEKVVVKTDAGTKLKVSAESLRPAPKASVKKKK